jgi:hypothetical protein
MAITGKPHRPDPAVDVDALINRGGSPPEEAPGKTSSTILLRLPTGLLEQVDAALKARPVKLPRHTWILEAIHEKLSREGSR